MISPVKYPPLLTFIRARWRQFFPLSNEQNIVRESSVTAYQIRVDGSPKAPHASARFTFEFGPGVIRNVLLSIKNTPLVLLPAASGRFHCEVANTYFEYPT